MVLLKDMAYYHLFLGLHMIVILILLGIFIIDVPMPPVTGLQVPQYLISIVVLMERQGDGFVGVPFGSLQETAAEGDGCIRIMTMVCTLPRFFNEA